MSEPTNENPAKPLLKILLGAAWIDGEVQAEERAYLEKMVSQYNLADDPEIKSLLYGLKSVEPAECYRWVDEYVGSHPSLDDYENLLESMSALIYSDGEVATEEAKLLTHLQSLDPQTESPTNKVIQAIQNLYERSLSALER